MKFFSRKWVKPEDLNPHGTLFGGTLLRWIDEEAVIYASCKLKTTHIVTRYMSEINFVSSAVLGEVIEIGMEVVKYGKTSITVECVVRNKTNQENIVTIDQIVFVHVDNKGKPKEHGRTD